jgi:hypothetical protein
MSKYLVSAAALSLLLSGTASAAQKKDQNETPPQLQRLLACKSVADAAQRLACFDRETTATEVAIQRSDLVAMDRAKIRATRRSLFGFSMPSLGIFGRDDKDAIKQVDGVVAGVARGMDGFRVSLQDGSRWAQTDGKAIAVEPRVGHKVVVKRGALGSYLMSVAGQPGVKVQRVN